MRIEMDNDEDSAGPVPCIDSDDSISETQNHCSEQAGIIMNIMTNGNARVEPEPKQLEDPSSVEVEENESAEVTQNFSAAVEEEKELYQTPDLLEGLKILNQFLADKQFSDFKEEVFSQLSEADIQKYKQEIKEPMWLSRMKEKFRSGEYKSISQVVSDFKLMIYNCQRFNGINHSISKKAAKMNTMLKQKLNLLKPDIRKIAQESSNPWQENKDGSFDTGIRKRTANHRLDDSWAMQSQLLMEEEQKAKEFRRQKKEEQRANKLAVEKKLIEWEEQNVTSGSIKFIIKHSWELPLIGLFLFLCDEKLLVGEVSMYELERCLAMAQQSKCLQRIMTALLSTPSQREKRKEKSSPDMPYGVWTTKLTDMVDSWYKVLDGCHGNKYQAACKLGLVEQSFEVLGPSNPLREKLFHDLDFYKKVWIMKSVCEYLVEKEESLRTHIETKQAIDQRAQILGSDRHGSQYIHMAQFCGPALRIYRQRKPQIPVVKEEDDAGMYEEEDETRLKPAKGKRGAKRKLNLDSSAAKWSRSATPMNDSETDGTVSPAPSDAKTKSRASSSRHSSPFQRETDGRSRQTSARNSPAPDTSCLDNLSIISSGRGRKTRNSVESTFFSMDLDTLLRQRSRRSRTARNVAKEVADAESVSTVGDESSQDGLRADTPSSVSASDKDMKIEIELVNGKLCTDMEGHGQIQSEVKSESQDSSDVDSVNKINRSSPLYSHTDRTEYSEEMRIKVEPSSCTCDKDSCVHQHSAEHASPRESCDIKQEMGFKVEPTSPPPVLANAISVGDVAANDGSRLKSPDPCDTNIQSATTGNPSSKQQTTPTCTLTSLSSVTSSVKKEGSADDSGFVSFQTSPRATMVGAVCEGEFSKHIPRSGNKSERYSSGNVDIIKEENRTGNAVSCDDHADSDTSRKMEEASLENEDSACSSQYGGAHDSSTTQSTTINALLDHADYSEEEMIPDPDDFELIVADMEGLDDLVKRFNPEQEESSPRVSLSARAGKRQKSKPTPKAPKRWACETELHMCLVRLQAELQQYRTRFATKTRQMRQNLQKEFLSYVEEVPKAEHLRAWDSDSDQNTDESSAEDTLSGERNSDSSEGAPSETVLAASKLKAPSKASSIASVDSSETDQRDIQEYEADVSSRGRLRKRRLIPNNIEDQGVKKKKLVKKTEETTPVVTANEMSSLVQRSEDGEIKLNLSNSQFLSLLEQGGLAASQLVQQLAATKTAEGQSLTWKPQGIKVVERPLPHGSAESTGAGKVGTAQSSAHPVMQKMLSTENLGNRRPMMAVTVQRKKAITTLTSSSSTSNQSSSASVALVSTTPVIIGSRASGTSTLAGLNMRSPLVMTASPRGGKQQLYVLSTQQQDELFRNSVLCYQQSQAGSLTVRPQVSTCSNSEGTKAAAAAATPVSQRAGQLVVVQQVSPTQGQGQANPQDQPMVIGINSRPSQKISLVPAQGVLGASPGTVAQAKAVAVVGEVPALKLVPTSKGQETMGVAVRQIPSGVKPPVIVDYPSGSRTLIVQSGKIPQRYAGNVTVKELLESRAANKTEDSDNPKPADGSQSKPGRIVVTTVNVPVTTPLSIVTSSMQRKAPANSLVQRLGSGVVRIPSQSCLDDALQTVVTSYHTTLPTADIKVPSPTTLPSLSPRKNITRIVQSTKAPIPTTTKVQTKHSPLLLTNAVVSGSSALAVGNRSISGVVAASNMMRPGTVVLPAGQGLTGVDVSGNEPVVVQVIPRGSAGASNMVQGYVLPQAGAVRTLQFANVKTTQAGSSTQDSSTLSNQAQSIPKTSSTQMVNRSVVSASAGAHLLNNQGSGQGLLMTLPSPSGSTPGLATGASSQPTGKSKTTSEVLKTMLAAKVVASSNSVPTSCASATTVRHTSVTSAAVAQVTTLLGSLSNQNSVSPSAQIPRIIRAPVAGVGSTVPNAHQTTVAHQNGFSVMPQSQQGAAVGRIVQTSAPLGMQLQNVAMAGLPSTVRNNAGAADSQRESVPGVVRMSVPAGVQLAGVQPGATAIRLVASSQAGSGAVGTIPPVLATLKPGRQVQQQLQLLAAAGGLQGIQLSGQPQPHLTFRTSTDTGQVAGGQAVSVVSSTQGQTPTVQLCFMQPSGQEVMNSTAPSVIPQPLVQGTGLRAPGGFSVFSSPHISPCSSGTVSKVIMANPATTVPPPASVQPNTPCSGVGQSLMTVPNINSGEENRMSMSVIPGPVKSQFIISPITSQSISDTGQLQLRQHSGKEVEGLPSQTINSVDESNFSTQPSSQPVAPTQLQSGIKGSLSSSDIQPIPAKVAYLDTSSGNSGAVLASLSQLIGSMKSNGPADDAAITSVARDSAGGSIPRIVMASGDHSASSTLLNLAAHVAPVTALSTAVSSSNPSAPTVVAANTAPLLQQITGMATVPVRPSQAPHQKLAVRCVGGQLLTDNNIPVTENNGEYKVLPKATLQIGSQTVTVRSPSSAMIQNLRNPASANIVSVGNQCQASSTSMAASGSALSNTLLSSAETVAGASQAQGVQNQTQGFGRTILRPDIKPEAVLSMYPQAQVKASPASGQAVKTEAHGVHQDSHDGGTTSVTPSATLEDAASHVPRQLNNMPLLKARLEQPRMGQPVGGPRTSVSAEALNGVAHGQQQISERPGDCGADQSQMISNGSEMQGCVVTNGQNDVEEEAALNLLSLAHQPCAVKDTQL